MKNETIEKIENEITKKTKMPEKLKENVRKEIFINILLAIGIMVYIILLILGSIGSAKVTRATDFQVFSFILLGVSIVLFEIAYKKENVKLAVNGMEILFIAIITLFLPYIVFELDEAHQKMYLYSTGLIGFYYIAKAIIIKSRAKISYVKQKSDIKEITKDNNKKVDILDEEIEEISEKREKPIKKSKKESESKKDSKKENIEKEINNNVKKEEKKETKKELKKETKKADKKETKKETKKADKKEVKKETKKEIKKKETPKEEVKAPKKRGRPKKENVEPEAPKKRGRPKKENVFDTAPKKRGRPRKVVKE